MRYEGVVDMFQTVKMLRTQRPAMVQTEVRYYEYTVQSHTFKLKNYRKPPFCFFWTTSILI